MGEESLIMWRDELAQMSRDDLLDYAMSTQSQMLDYRELVLEYQNLIEQYKGMVERLRGAL